MKRYNHTTSWDNFGSVPTGCSEGLRKYILLKYKEAVQLEGTVLSTSKIKRGTGKGLEERATPDNSVIERGDTPKEDYARVPVELSNKR